MNEQAPEPRLLLADGSLSVHSIWTTIQGEGPFAGWPAVFVRLAGCNLQCPGCDTDYTSYRKHYTPEGLLAVVKSLFPPSWKDRLVVITGGEPFRQNLGPFVELLALRGNITQIETNGILFLEQLNYKLATIVCSPKAPKIHPSLVPKIDYLKYVGRAGELSLSDGLPTRTLDNDWDIARIPISRSRIFLQPCDDRDPVQNSENVKACVESCFKYGYKLSLQLHKIIGVR